MNALIISPTFPPVRSGGSDFAFGLSERLAGAGMDVTVITTWARDVRMSDRFTVLPIMRSWSWRELPRLLLTIRRLRPHVVEIHFSGPIYRHHPMIGFLPALLKHSLAIPRIVLHVEYPEPLAPRPRGFSARVMNKAVSLVQRCSGMVEGYGSLLRDSDQIILLCESHRPVLSAYDGATERKSIVIAPPPPIAIPADEDGSIRRQERARLNVGENDILLAFYGYVYPNKGIETLLNAFARVSADTAHLLIIGGANEVVLRTLDRLGYMDELKERVASAGLEGRVTWTDYYPAESERPSALLRAADVCILPYDDGVLMHRSTVGVAAAHHLPIVTTRGEFLDNIFVDGENVLLARAKDADSLADAIGRVVNDPILRKRLAHGAANLASKHFNWERCIERTAAVFRGETEGSLVSVAA